MRDQPGLDFDEWRQVLLNEWGDPLPQQIQPDCVVEGTGAGDWQAVFDLLRASTWHWVYRNRGIIASLPTAADAFTPVEPTDGHATIGASVALDLRIIFYLFEPGRIDFDFDLDEVLDQGALETLCAAIREIGRAVRRDVKMLHQGSDDVFCEYRFATDRFELTAT